MRELTQSEKVSKSLIGKTGENSRRWKGDTASYVAKHMWISKHNKKTGICQECGNSKNTRTEWSNISGTHKRDINDYIELCPSCHRKKDLKKTHCPQGHELNDNNLYINTRGHRECKICMKESRKRYAKKN